MCARNSLNQRLRQARHAAGLTAEAAAVRAEISYPFLRALESGRKSPSLRTLGRLAEVYGVPIGDLFGPPEPAEAEAAAS